MCPALRLLLALCLVLGSAFAADKKKEKAEPSDALPVLISTKGNAPKWKNTEELQQFAAKGDPKACMELAERSLEGEGVPKDVARATALFEQAGKGGIASGWFRLGKIYHDGLNGAPDYPKALEYFTTAARAGVAEAQHNIGAMLVSARGVKRNYIEGLAWLIVAKKTGAQSDAETQVRSRISRRPADIAAAEARAAEIAADLPNASVRTGVTPLPPPPALPARIGTPAPAKSGVVAPKLDPATAPKIDVPINPVAAPKKG